MRNIKLTIMYDGKDFNGWQKQPNKLNIQGTIEKVISEMTGEEMKKMLFQIQSGQYSFYPTSGLKMVVTRKPRKQLLSVQLFNGLKEKEVINTATYTISFAGEVCSIFMRAPKDSVLEIVDCTLTYDPTNSIFRFIYTNGSAPAD